MKPQELRISKIKEIVRCTRNQGSTTWILKAATRDPDCVIVCSDTRQMLYLINMYERLLPWWKKMGKIQYPKFKTVDEEFRGLDSPVVFDNSTFIRNDIF